MVIKTILISVFLVTVILGKSQVISTTESLEWINSKLKIYSEQSVTVCKVSINTKKELVVYESRAGELYTYFTMIKLPLENIYTISVREEDDFIAIDILPKEGRYAKIGIRSIKGLIAHSDIEKMFNENFFYEPLKDIPQIQISLKKISISENIPSRIVKALKNIIKNYGVSLTEDKF